MLRSRPVVGVNTGMQQADRNAEVNQRPTFQPGTYIYERDSSTGALVSKLRVGRLLGRGGFAKCYEVFDPSGCYAIKAVNRASLDKPKTLQKLHSEIAIHSRMKHKNIVNFVRTFKDRYYVYILLEKCDNGTLMEMLKVRALTVAETQYIMLQCLNAMQYMHEESVIHRDLKPGNIMLDGNINVKIGDFGLAAALQYDGERKRTVCGTPNYIAPEIIDRRSHGHSFEVDTWSLGVILYTLLVGQPPFQMQDVESTYNRIRACRYDFPATVPPSARNLIQQILQSSPIHRPTILDIRRHPFFSSPPPPKVPPTSFAAYGLRLSTVPSEPSRRASAPQPMVTATPPTTVDPLDNYCNNNQSPRQQVQSARREMLRPISANVPSAAAMTPLCTLQKMTPASNNYVEPRPCQRPLTGSTAPMPPPVAASSQGRQNALGGGVETTQLLPQPPNSYTPPDAKRPGRGRGRGKDLDAEEQRELTVLHDQLQENLLGGEEEGAWRHSRPQPAPPPAAETLLTPLVWVTSCADFSSKYGLCYRLNTGHTGAHFNDSTKMVWEPLTGRVEYYARVRVELPQSNGGVGQFAKDELEFFNMSAPPGTLEKKITLIKYFKSYLGRVRYAEDKVRVVACTQYRASDTPHLSDPHISKDFVYVKRWLRTPEAIVFRLSNKTVQVCFVDQAEVILSSEWKVVTYTDATGNRRTLPLNAIAAESEEAAARLRYTKSILYQLIKDHAL